MFLFELIDLYDKKNIPKVIYCIHALSHLLHKKGLAPRIKDLLGKLQFADNVLDSTAQGLEESGVAMPAFGGIQDALAKEMDEPSEEELRAQHFQKNLKSVIKCQAIARGRKQQKIYASRKLRYKSKENLVSKVA